MTKTADEHIRRALEVLFKPGDVVELRIPGTRVISGYYNDFDKLAKDAAKFSGNCEGIYVTINPVKPALIARSGNKVNTNAKNTTSDHDILKRCKLQIDIDPKRPAGISSSDEEHASALNKAVEIREWLTKEIDWPRPMTCDSGNGAHVNYGLDLPNDENSELLVKRCLRALAYKFNDERVEIDEKTFNASRITKLYGTLACKGENISERPHRMSKVLEVPERLEPVPIEKLKVLADLAPKDEEPQQESQPSGHVFDIEGWIKKHGVKVKGIKKEPKKTVYILEECFFDPNHKDASIVQFTTGKLGFNCFHDSCKDTHWKQVREKFEGPKEKRKEEDDGEEEKRVPQAKALINFCLEDGLLLYHDQKQDPYARVPISENGHYADLRVKGTQFRMWLAKRLWEEAGKAPNEEAIGSARNVITAMAIFSGERHDLKVRVAEASGKIYYDLTNSKCEVVEIDEQGYRVIQSPILFRRYSHQTPQVYPEPGGKVEDVLKYVNIKDVENQHLFIVDLISKFIPDIPHTVNQSYGSHGGAKSTADMVRKRLVDPSAAEALTFPKDVNEFIQGVAHHYLAVFDNVSYIPKWVSDLICKVVSGLGFSKRELYSDDEDVIYALKHCIALNGINITGESPDLADRSIFQEFERIPLSERKDEKKFWAEFERDRPNILGVIFDCISKAISIRRSLELPGLPRMADFALWGYAIAEVLKFKGRGGKEFLEAYDANIAAQNKGILEASIIGELVVLFMKDRESWGGSASDLLAEIEKLAEQHKVSTRQKGWPKAAHVLTKKLNIIKLNLKEENIEYEVAKSGGIRTIVLRKSREFSAPSVPSATNGSGGLEKEGTLGGTLGKRLDEAPHQAPQKNNGRETTWDARDAWGGKIPTLKGVAPTRTLKIEKLDNPVRGRCSWCGEDRLLRWYVDGNSACNECKEDEEELAKTQSDDKSRKTLEVLGDFIREWYGNGAPSHPEDPDVRNIFIQTLIAHCEKANIPITREEAKRVVEAEFQGRGWI